MTTKNLERCSECCEMISMSISSHPARPSVTMTAMSKNGTAAPKRTTMADLARLAGVAKITVNTGG